MGAGLPSGAPPCQVPAPTSWASFRAQARACWEAQGRAWRDSVDPRTVICANGPPSGCPGCGRSSSWCGRPPPPPDGAPGSYSGDVCNETLLPTRTAGDSGLPAARLPARRGARAPVQTLPCARRAAWSAAERGRLGTGVLPGGVHSPGHRGRQGHKVGVVLREPWGWPCPALRCVTRDSGSPLDPLEKQGRSLDPGEDAAGPVPRRLSCHCGDVTATPAGNVPIRQTRP